MWILTALETLSCRIIIFTVFSRRKKIFLDFEIRSQIFKSFTTFDIVAIFGFLSTLWPQCFKTYVNQGCNFIQTHGRIWNYWRYNIRSLVFQSSLQVNFGIFSNSIKNRTKHIKILFLKKHLQETMTVWSYTCAKARGLENLHILKVVSDVEMKLNLLIYKDYSK